MAQENIKCPFILAKERTTSTGSAKSQSVQFKNWTYSPEGLLYCSCGVCLMPSPKQKRKIKTEIEIMSDSYYTVREGSSRGAGHGETQLQHDHWKAKDARVASKKWYPSAPPKLVHFFKSKLHVVVTSTESKFRSLPHQETVQNPWL